MESQEGKTEMELPRPTSPCWKKKSADAGFVANFKDHLDQLVSTSREQHRICLKKSMRELKDFIRLKKQGAMVKPSKDDTERNSAADKEKESSMSVHEATSI